MEAIINDDDKIRKKGKRGVVIKRVDILYIKYSKLFKNFTKPLSQKEICSEYKISKTDFCDKVYPRLRKIGLIYRIKKSNINIHFLKDKYEKNWKENVTYYYIKTPKSAKFTVSFINIIKNFGKYIESKKEYKRNLKRAIPLMQRIELSKRLIFKNKSEEIKYFKKVEQEYNEAIKKYDKEFKENKNVNWLIEENNPSDEILDLWIKKYKKSKGRPKKQEFGTFSSSELIIHYLNPNAVYSNNYEWLYINLSEKLNKIHFILNQELNLSKLLEYELNAIKT